MSAACCESIAAELVGGGGGGVLRHEAVEYWSCSLSHVVKADETARRCGVRGVTLAKCWGMWGGLG